MPDQDPPENLANDPAIEAAVITETPAVSPELSDLAKSLNPRNMGAADPASPVPVVTDPATPAPQQQKAALNHAELRKKSEAAEGRAATAERRAAELAAELETLKANIPTRDNQRQVAELEKRIAEQQEKMAKWQDTALRTNARATPQYRDTEGYIREAGKEITAILAMPEVADVHRLSLEDLSTPGGFNRAIAALTESGLHAEADTLRKNLDAMRYWKSSLDKMEAEGAEKQKAFETDRTGSLQKTFRQTAEMLRERNPALLPGTAEFKALPEDVQKFVMEAHTDASQTALAIMGKPVEEQARDVFSQNLGLQIRIREVANLTSKLDTVSRENETLKSRLAEYEKRTAKPAGEIGGGSKVTSTTDIGALAASLNPRRMKSY